MTQTSLVGIVIVQVFVNLVAKPSQKTGVPYPVINRAIFGVKGANIPAVIRGLIAVAWYGVQTFLAAESLNIIFLKFIPATQALTQMSFLGLDALGWISFAILWVAQAALFWTGMETIRRFIDWAGPAVYVVMVILAVYLVSKAGFSGIDLNLHSGETLSFWASIPVMVTAIAIVVSYFSGPMLNFGDFARYGRSFEAVKRGNLLGLPVNFLFFSLLTVITASATVPVFGSLITDPIETVQKIDTPFAILLGGLTFVTATVGINIVANFISPAFDFSHVNPQKISWRTGGMIAAVGSVIGRRHVHPLAVRPVLVQERVQPERRDHGRGDGCRRHPAQPVHRRRRLRLVHRVRARVRHLRAVGADPPDDPGAGCR